MNSISFYGQVLTEQYQKSTPKKALTIFLNEVFSDLQEDISACCKQTDEGYEIEPDSFNQVGAAVQEAEKICIENIRFFPEYRLDIFERLVKQRFPGLYQPLLLTRASDDLEKAGVSFEFNTGENEED